jgi:subtilisin family serine protease
LKKTFLLFLLTSLAYSQNFNLSIGWHLLGVTLDTDSSQTFDQECVEITWSYHNKTWEHNPQKLDQGMGFWLKATSKCDLPAYTEPLQIQQWSLFDANAGINLEKYYEKYSGKGVKVAIIDDSIDDTHEDLPDMTVLNQIVQKSSNYHGTAVSGIIAAQSNNVGIRGIAPDAEYLFVKMKPRNTDDEYIALFEQVKEWGADVVNCSWGTNNVGDGVKQKIIQLSTNERDGKGMAIVFATGNEQIDIIHDESGIDEVIAVGATNSENERSYYSNYGTAIDILAPGGLPSNGITTLDPMGSYGRNEGNYIENIDLFNFSGTSASAPIITGVIALMLEANSELTRDDIEYILHESADKIGDVEYDSNGHNIYYGYGKINADKAIEMAESFMITRELRVLKSVSQISVQYDFNTTNQIKEVDFR